MALGLAVALACATAACNGRIIGSGTTASTRSTVPPPAPAPAAEPTTPSPAPAPAPTPSPAAPVVLGAFAVASVPAVVASDSPQISWAASQNAVSYDLRVGATPGCDPPLQRLEGLTTTTATLAPLADGTYYVCLRARGPGGEILNVTGGDFAIVIDTTPPGAFTLTSPQPVAGLRPIVRWTAAADAAAYDLVVASDAACASPLHSYPDLTVTEQALPALASATYHVCLTARDAAGNGRAPANAPYLFRVPSPVVLGAPDFLTNPAARFGLDGPAAASICGTKLFIADANHNRVTVYDGLPTTMQEAPGLALGQPSTSFTRANTPAVGAATMSGPKGVHCDGTRLFVADTANNRVLVWTTLPTASGTPANLVLGQPDFTSVAFGTSASTMRTPTGVFSDGTRLFVADQGNHRVLVWSALPTQNGQAASFVLGQADADSGAANRGGAAGAGTMSSPTSVATNGDDRLYVADRGNNRVLVFSPIPAALANASQFIGQPNASAASANNGTRTKGLSGPNGVLVAGDGLLVVDQNNNRVAVWTEEPATDHPDIEHVLGQPDKTTFAANSGGATPTGATASAPAGVASNGTRIFVADQNNHRVTRFDRIPQGDAEAASFALGQPALTTAVRSSPGVVGAALFNQPRGVFLHGTKLFVADRVNNRVLIWSTLPTSLQQPADIVLGQPDKTSVGVNTGGISASTMNGPLSIYFDGTRLYVTDAGNHRVLIWSQMPASDGAPADHVLGQTAMNASSWGVSAVKFNLPSGIHGNSEMLYVSDYSNNRVLIWSPPPTSSNDPADAVLGQPDLDSGGANAGGLGASSLRNPGNVLIAGGRFYVADVMNHRILIWNELPAERKPATGVLGQPDFETAVLNGPGGTPTASNLNTPWAMWADGDQVLVADSNNGRILFWDSFPATPGKAADRLLGAPDLTTFAPSIGPQSYRSPQGLWGDAGRLYISDSFNNRVLIVPRP